LQLVQVATVRYIARHYDPNDFLGEPKAFCLVVSESAWNREMIATAMSGRNSDLDPPTTLLARLRDVQPRVVPISQCQWGSSLEEVLTDSGERAVSLGVGYPNWVTPNLARLSVTVRENQQVWYRYQCSLERGPEGWGVRQCV